MPFLQSSIALSQPLKFLLTILSRLLNILPMKEPSDYRKAYASAQRELAEILAEQERLEKRLVVVRQSIQTLAALCESEGIEVASSDEADHLLKNTRVADEIRSILHAQHPKWMRPRDVRDHLEQLGWDVALFQNPLATIHMILKRLVESNQAEEDTNKEGKKIYRWRPRSLGERIGTGRTKGRYGSPPVTEKT